MKSKDEVRKQRSGKRGQAPDPQQRDAIYCDTNAVVSAGAGSGKTFVLTERFYRLVADGKAGVDEILTLTFTRKAAAEMFERIYRRLLAEREDYLSKQIRNFDKAQISTLDSFCAQIARTGAGLFGITPDFSIDDSAVTKLCEEAALNFILRNGENEVLSAFITDFGFERVWKQFFTAFGYEHVSIARDIDFSETEERQRNYLLKRLRSHGEKLLSAGTEIRKLDASIGRSIEKNQAALVRLPALEKALQNNRYGEILDILASVSLSKAGTGNSKKPELIMLGEYVETFREHQRKTLLIVRTLENWEESVRMFQLLKEFQKDLQKEKRKRGVCSFYDVLTLSLEILRTNRPIRDYFKSMFRYIMIDEFQDNNQMQKQLLYYLAEKKDLFSEEPRAEDLEDGKLFFVGDDKQSIYRFRGADVSVFKALCGELSDAAGTHVTMEKNYRSNSHLIHFYNFLFRSVMAGNDDTAEDDSPSEASKVAPYEAEFSPLQRNENGPEVESTITFFYKPYDKEEDLRSFAGGDESEAYTIAAYLKEQIGGRKLIIRDEGKVRPARYEDVALLMRSTGNQVIYERVFRQFDIPYSTDSVRTLFLEAPFNDFYNIIQLALFPSDNVSYAAYLRSPLVGCSDEALMRILLLEEGVFPESVYELPLDETDMKMYRAGKELFSVLRGKIGIWSIGKIIRYIWYDWGYRYILLTNPAYHPYLEYFDYLYYLAIDADKRGMALTEFVDFMRNNLGKYERLEELDILKESKEGVQILTIHKSKGLEFPVVVLANTGNAGSRSNDSNLFYLSREYGITFSIGGEGGMKDNFFYSLAREEQKNMEIAEIKRLLYVACTRAKDHLLLTGYHHRNNQNSKEVMLNMVFQALRLTGEEEDGVLTLGDGGGGREESGGEETPPKVRFTRIQPVRRDKIRPVYSKSSLREIETKLTGYREMPTVEFSFPRKEFAVTELAAYQLETLAAEDEKRKIVEMPPFADLEEGVYSAPFGTLAHYIIEQKLKTVYAWEEIPDKYLAPFPREILPVVRRNAESMTERFFSSDLMKEVRKAERIETEYDFILRFEQGDGEYFVSGRIDLYFETEAKACVVDFKTDRVYVPGVYSRQLDLYARAAASYSGKPVECYLYFLRDGSIKSTLPDLDFVPIFPTGSSEAEGGYAGGM